MSNYLCCKNARSNKACSKDVYSNDAYSENTTVVHAELRAFLGPGARAMCPRSWEGILEGLPPEPGCAECQARKGRKAFEGESAAG